MQVFCYTKNISSLMLHFVPTTEITQHILLRLLWVNVMATSTPRGRMWLELSWVWQQQQASTPSDPATESRNDMNPPADRSRHWASVQGRGERWLMLSLLPLAETLDRGKMEESERLMLLYISAACSLPARDSGDRLEPQMPPATSFSCWGGCLRKVQHFVYFSLGFT